MIFSPTQNLTKNSILSGCDTTGNALSLARLSLERNAKLRDLAVRPEARIRHVRTNPVHKRVVTPELHSGTSVASLDLHEMPTNELAESYSIWLMPFGPLASKLQGAITLLAAQYQGSPCFPPHVTLAADISKGEEETLRIAENLANSLKPYRANFDKVSYGNKYFQCVYVLVDQAEEVMTSARAARVAFDLEENQHYMPHLSLLYGDVELNERSKVASQMQGLLLAGMDAPEDRGFLVDELAVWATPLGDNTLSSWRLLKTFPLKGGEAGVTGAAAQSAKDADGPER